MMMMIFVWPNKEYIARNERKYREIRDHITIIHVCAYEDREDIKHLWNEKYIYTEHFTILPNIKHT